MIIRGLFVVIFACICIESIAQLGNDSINRKEEYIINTDSYRQGIYKTFEEFKYNSPSMVEEFTFDGKHLWLIDKNTGKLKKVNKSKVWGFSDGTRLFIRWSKYIEITEKGRYCYFMDKGVRVAFGYSMFPPMLVPVPYPYKDEVIINFNTGNTYVLSKRLMKKILTTDDPELLTEFQQESKKRKKLLEYIKKYNERNVSKIK